MWWFLIPLRILSMVMSIIADGVVVLVVGAMLALWAGWVPQSVIDDQISRAGKMVEAAIMPRLPHFHAPIPQAPQAPQIKLDLPGKE